MADRAISDLTAVSTITNEDSFVLEQNNSAMRLTGRLLKSWLLDQLDGHGGITGISKISISGNVDTYEISYADTDFKTTFTVTNGKEIASIQKTDTTGLVDTYTITFNDGTMSTFTVTNGRSISSIELTSQDGLEDTYTITYNDASTPFEYQVTNGRGIQSVTKESVGLEDTYTVTYNDGSTYEFVVTNGEKGDTGDNVYTWIKYSENEPAADTDMSDNPNNWMGIYYGASDVAPASYMDYDWFKIKGEKGDKGDSIALEGQDVRYATNQSGSAPPETGWQTTIPTVAQGSFLWTRTVTTFTNAEPVTTYTSTRYGVDGSGSVSSVNGLSPVNGDVTTLGVVGSALMIY